MKGFAIAMLAMIAMAQLMVQPSEAITCGEISSMLAPCLTYLRSGGSPTAQCCDGLRNLQSNTPTQAERQTACTCLKNAAASMQVRPDAAQDLPRQCKVTTNVPISPNVDCSSIP